MIENRRIYFVRKDRVIRDGATKIQHRHESYAGFLLRRREIKEVREVKEF